MHIDISGHHLDITDTLREYIHAKFARLERHFSQIIRINVICTEEKLSVEKQVNKIEATLHVPGDNIFATATDYYDMYAAVDALVDKLDKQLVKRKEKSSER